MQAAVFELITGRPLRPHERAHFPGSQPVSLDRANLALLASSRYAVTWKADGTRYLVYAVPWGTYLLDRAFGVHRVQARFPRGRPPAQNTWSAPLTAAPCWMARWWWMKTWRAGGAHAGS